MKPCPPRLARWLLTRLSLYDANHSIFSDFEETFLSLVEKKGPFRARLWYSTQTLQSILSYVRLVFASGLDLLANYIKVAFRSLRRHKIYSAINITGLTIGLAAVLLIVLFLSRELSFDRHHKNAERIYRIVSGDFVGMPYILGDRLREQVPGIEHIARLKHLSDESSFLLESHGRKYLISDLYMTDASVFKVFSFRFLYGDPTTALRDPNSIVLSQSTALRFFGREDPIGEVLNHDRDLALQVTAVVADFPSTSHFHFKALVPTVLSTRFHGSSDLTSWTSFNYLTYLLLSPQASATGVLDKATTLINAHQKKPRALRLQPLLDIHLHSHLRGELEENSDISTMRIYAAVGAIILFLACINFMNLGSAHSLNRSREVGIRKVLGAKRNQIARQFISESVFIVFLSALLAVLLAQIVLPLFRQLTYKDLAWADAPWGLLIPVLFIAIIFTGVAAGSYPGFIASSYQPVHTLQGRQKTGAGRGPFRNLLVTLQFIISIFFIGCTLFVLNQMHFLRSQKLGLDQERIITIKLPDEAMRESASVKAELLKHPAVLKATCSSFLPSVPQNRISSTWEGRMEEESVSLWRINVDEDFIDTFGIEVVEGEAFKAKHTPGSTYIVNQAAAELIGNRTVGTMLTMASGLCRPGKIIGVVKDFNFRSLHNAIEPMVLFLDQNRMLEFRGRQYNHAAFRYISVKAAGGGLKEAVQHVEDVCRAFFPYAANNWFFFDEEFGRMYRREQRTAGLMVVLSVIAVALAGMGLLGLSIFAVEKRRKEIGIRRILGASVPSVLLLFFRDFLYIHALAVLIGFPIVYVVVNRWLNNFAYRIAAKPWVFAVTAVLTAALFFATGSSSVVKAAASNPVESLRQE